MEDLIRDAVIRGGGRLPVIGGMVFVNAWLGWFAYKAHSNGEPAAARWLAGGAVALAVLTLFSVPAAERACRDLYATDPVQYEITNCRVLVQCFGAPPQRFMQPRPC